PRKAAKNMLHAALVQSRIAELRDQMSRGGLSEGLARAMLYIRMAGGSADERGFEAIRRIRETAADEPKRTLEEFKAMLREQFFLLLIDEDSALSAIPGLLPANIEERQAAFDKLVELLGARGQLTDAETDRLERMKSLFGIEREPARKLRSADRK